MLSMTEVTGESTWGVEGKLTKDLVDIVGKVFEFVLVLSFVAVEEFEGGLL